ncbi:hypothetical protein GWK47_010451 [Chionoecetes opilio]|uniref:Uncharacterized protein n=1 Tax=Chionoecetes opilio TaxID=41210 RepID=A0A8J4XY38_CHIOP|nr:hypothetical protein GWK47_010451 [Chionoecetes opilio]
MQAPCTMPVFETVVSKQKAMILSLTLSSSTSFKTTAATFLPVESELAGTPRRNSASSSPVRRTAMRSSVSPERDGRSFPSQCRTNLSGISWFRSSTIFSASCSLPAIRAQWTVLFETAILPMSIPRT